MRIRLLNHLSRYIAIKKNTAEVGLSFKDCLITVKISHEIGRRTKKALEILKEIFGLEMTSFIDLPLQNVNCCLI